VYGVHTLSVYSGRVRDDLDRVRIRAL
jgi:hypothetical protein